MKIDSSANARLRQLWADAPADAAKWLSSVVEHAHVSVPGLDKLQALLGRIGHSDFDPKALRQHAEENPQLMSFTTALQQTRATTMGWNAEEPIEAPAFTGVVEHDDDQVRLRTAHGTFQLATSNDNTWSSRWAAEVGAFTGQVVTVRGWPDSTNSALAVDGFAPGESGDFVQGRVTLTETGQVAIQVRPGKLVEISDPALAKRLKEYVRVGFILPGKAEATPSANGGTTWRYAGNPDGVFMLTKLNPSTLDGGVVRYDADTPFEKTLITTEHGEFPDHKLGERIFVYGRIPDAGEDLGVKPPTERVRRFVAKWVSEPIRAAWQKAAETKGETLTVAKGELGAVVGAFDPTKKSPPGSFAPAGNLTALENIEGLRHGAVQQPNGLLERWERGRKLEEGPVDSKGRPHGEWTELSFSPDGTTAANGERGGKYETSVKGRYAHGLREGLWVQYRDGAAHNAWKYEGGALVAAGHVDEQGREHGAWTLVSKDGRHDGGEGEFDHGRRTDSWWYFKPGTAQYERAEFYHPNGSISFEGPVRSQKIGEQTYELRVGEWKFFDPDGKLTETKTYRANETIDANGKPRGA